MENGQSVTLCLWFHFFNMPLLGVGTDRTGIAPFFVEILEHNQGKKLLGLKRCKKDCLEVGD